MDGSAPHVGAGTGIGPLSGLRVLDMSRVLAGPWCTQCLADLGAEVLKIEAPGEGDETRTWGPPSMGGVSAYFACANRAKQSLIVDLKSEAGRDMIRGLAAKADILVENFKGGTMERMGLSYDELTKINPRLIYCAISGYGRTGPNSERAGYDFVIQAETGLMSVTGFPDGAPTKVGVAVSDLFSGLYASQAILAAVVGRARTGRGTFIDVALFDCQLAALANVAANVLATGGRPKRYGNAHPNVVPYELFDAADGPIALAIGNDRQFRTLCNRVLDLPELVTDPDFSTNALRVVNRVRLRPLLADRILSAPRSHWLARLKAESLPGGELFSVDEALQSPQAVERGLVKCFDSENGADAGRIKVVRYPVNFGDGLPDPTPPPALGEGGEELANRWMKND